MGRKIASAYCDDVLGILDGVEIAKLISTGEIKEIEVVEAAIARAVANKPAKNSSKFVKFYNAMGFRTIGKSTLPELGLTCTTEPLSTGPTRNPWNLDCSTGGSSGGSASVWLLMIQFIASAILIALLTDFLLAPAILSLVYKRKQ